SRRRLAGIGDARALVVNRVPTSKSNSRYCSSSSVGPPSSPSARSEGRKIQALSFRESGLFKGLRGPLGRFFVAAPILPAGRRRPPPRRRQMNHACLVKLCRDRRRLLIERSTIAWIL